MAPHEQTVRFLKDAWQAEKFPQREKKTFVLKCIYVTVCAKSATTEVITDINHKSIYDASVLARDTLDTRAWQLRDGLWRNFFAGQPKFSHPIKPSNRPAA
jgi:hypothetical protein